MLSLLFDLLYFLPALVYAPVFFLKSRRVGEDPKLLFSERWGSYAPEKLAKLAGKRVLWIHAVSVGETMVARRWIESLREIKAPFHFVLTTVTPTGQKLARQAEAEDLTAFYVPFDFSFCVNAFLNAVKPEALVLVETEIWPNLILRSAQKKIPISLINARLSEKSLSGYSRFRFFLSAVFSKIEMVLAQEQADAMRFERLGISPARVEEMGNIKFDTAVPSSVPADFRREKLGLNSNHLVWIAGSTHPGEEKKILNVFKRLQLAHPNLRLILAPRHVERTESLLQELAEFKLFIQRWSQFDLSESWDVLVVDQIGILKNIYALGNFVFMGGSWVEHGGQNPIEPAVFDLPVLHGPHVFNFKQIYAIFDEAGGAFCVADEASCFQKVEAFINQPGLASEAGQCAGSTVKKYRGASLKQAQRVMELIQRS